MAVTLSSLPEADEVVVVMEIESKVLHMIGKCSTTELYSSISIHGIEEHSLFQGSLLELRVTFLDTPPTQSW